MSKPAGMADIMDLESGLRACRVLNAVEIYDPRNSADYDVVSIDDIADEASEAGEGLRTGYFSLDHEEVIQIFNWVRGA